jgi:hypothetical protein
MTGRIRPSRRPTEMLLLAAVLSLAAPLDAQELVGWQLLYSSSDYDYRLEESYGVAEFDSLPEPLEAARVTVAQMLVRHLEAARLEVVGRVEARGLDAAGYDRYATSTHLVDVECASNAIRVVETTDFALDGTALHLSRRVNPGATRAGLLDPSANEALLRRLCTDR